MLVQNTLFIGVDREQMVILSPNIFFKTNTLLNKQHFYNRSVILNNLSGPMTSRFNIIMCSFRKS